MPEIFNESETDPENQSIDKEPHGVLYGKNGEDDEDCEEAEEYEAMGQKDLDKPLRDKISDSRNKIQSAVDDVPISEKGFFMLNGMLYGTAGRLSAHSKKSCYSIIKDAKERGIDPIIGKTRSGVPGKYYPVSVLTDSSPKTKHPTAEKSDNNPGKTKLNASQPAEVLPIAEKGFLTSEDGMRCGIPEALSISLGISEHRIIKRIREDKIKPVIGQNRFGHRVKYYPEDIFKAPWPEKIEEKKDPPIAATGTINYWAKHHNLDEKTLKAHVKKMEGKMHDGKETLLYSKDYIEELVNNLHKQLLIKLHEEKKLPRCRIKKHSTLHHALEGDLLLLIPEEYTGIYQWLENELELNKLKPGQVYVLFDKRNGVSVVLKSELVEISKLEEMKMALLAEKKLI